MNLNKIAIIIPLLSILGCVPVKESHRPTQPTVHQDEFSRWVTTESPIVKIKSDDFYHLSYRFVSRRDKVTLEDGGTALLVTIKYFKNWRFYDTVTFQGGQTFRINDVTRRTTTCTTYGCLFNEYLAIELSNDFIESHKNGFKVKLNSKFYQSTVIEVNEIL